MLKWILGFMAFWWDILKRTWRLLLGLYKRADLVGGFLTWLGLGVATWLEFIPLRVWLIGGGVLLLYAIMAAIYEKFREIEAEKEELEKQAATEDQRAALKEFLAEALREGEDLLRSNPSNEEAEAWAEKIGRLLSLAFLNTGEAQLFYSDEGLPPLDYAEPLRQHLQTPAQKWMRRRLARLADLIRRSDSLQIRPGFNGRDYILPD